MFITGMAPLVVGDPADLNSEKTRSARKEQVNEMTQGRKEAGAGAVSNDIWLALVWKSRHVFDWSYPDMLLNAAIEAEVLWNPILSMHRCGGNVGDNYTVLLPEWLWAELAAKVPSGNVNALRYVSEQGNASNEYVSCWAVDLVLPYLKEFFEAFMRHYADKAQHICAINISLGPAGELRLPSYNSHDTGTDFPHRGALQCYSELALLSFRQWLVAKYGSLPLARQAWTSALATTIDYKDVPSCVRAAWVHTHDFAPPKDADTFFKHEVHTKTLYGHDVYDWQSDSLLGAGKKIMTCAINVFGAPGAAFEGIDVDAKVPGVHWYMGRWDGDKIVWAGRLAELNAGMLRTSEMDEWNSDSLGRGYRRIVGMFKELQSVQPKTRVVMHFTCLEKADGEDSHQNAQSLARSLVKWVGAECRRQGVTVKGENALAGGLYNVTSWKMLRTALNIPGEEGFYEGLTLLRLSDVLRSDAAKRELKSIIAIVGPVAVKTKPAAKDAQPVDDSEPATTVTNIATAQVPELRTA